MSGLIKTFTPTPPPIQPAILTPAPTEDDEEAKAAAAAQEELEKKRKGRTKTILTGAQGDLTTAPTTQKILLGT